jgi:hypothetical protein
MVASEQDRSAVTTVSGVGVPGQSQTWRQAARSRAARMAWWPMGPGRPPIYSATAVRPNALHFSASACRNRRAPSNQNIRRGG